MPEAFRVGLEEISRSEPTQVQCRSVRGLLILLRSALWMLADSCCELGLSGRQSVRGLRLLVDSRRHKRGVSRGLDLARSVQPDQVFGVERLVMRFACRASRYLLRSAKSAGTSSRNSLR